MFVALTHELTRGGQTATGFLTAAPSFTGRTSPLGPVSPTGGAVPKALGRLLREGLCIRVCRLWAREGVERIWNGSGYSCCSVDPSLSPSTQSRPFRNIPTCSTVFSSGQLFILKTSNLHNSHRIVQEFHVPVAEMLQFLTFFNICCVISSLCVLRLFLSYLRMGVISRAPVTCISDLTFRIRNILLGLPGTVTKFRRFSTDIILLSNPHSPVSLASSQGFLFLIPGQGCSPGL